VRFSTESPSSLEAPWSGQTGAASQPTPLKKRQQQAHSKIDLGLSLLLTQKTFPRRSSNSLILSEVCVYKTIIIINFKKPGRRHYYNAKIF
jgi:hypothetical protein